MNQYKLVKEYFLESEQRFYALMLLLGVIAGVIAGVVLMSMLAGWTTGFWAALSEMSYPLYIQSLQTLLALTVSLVGVNIFKDSLLGALTIEWDSWLKTRLVNKFTAADGNNYAELGRHPSQIDNPSQRIQEDAPSFAKQTLKLGVDLLQSILTIVTFIGHLWVIGGAATFVILGVSLTIPGYLVWVALLFAVVSGVLTHLIGKALVSFSNTQQALQADFRGDIEIVSQHAESVAQDHGEHYFKQSLINKIQALSKNAYKRLLISIEVSAFNDFFQQVIFIFPYVIGAPLYFARQTSLGQLMEIGFSFIQIQFALNWFSNSYEEIAAYQAASNRVAELENVMEDGGLITAARSIVVHVNAEQTELHLQNINIAEPSNSAHIMRGLNLTFRVGENTLIKGQSGLGKSTLFKVIAGTWKYGDGDMVFPNSGTRCFLPQKPVIPNNTLKAVLAYPDTVDTFTDEEYVEVLRMVKNMDKFIVDLDTKAVWSNKLSPGQQQRISFARALLQKPDWLFLDEATSALDEESEHEMYSLVKNQLPGTTFISIAHRSTVDKYHDRIVTFSADDERQIQLGDSRHGFFQQRVAASNDDDSVLFFHAASPSPL